MSIVAWYSDEGVRWDGILDERPGVTRALVELRRGRATSLLVASRDVLGDDLLGAMIEKLVQEGGGRLVTVRGEAASPAVVRLIAAFDTYESARGSARMTAAWAASKERGERLGNVPWGFRVGRDGRKLVRDHLEERITFVVRAMWADGCTLDEIVTFLADNGVVGRSGQPLGRSRIYQLVHGSPRKQGADAAPGTCLGRSAPYRQLLRRSSQLR